MASFDEVVQASLKLVTAVAQVQITESSILKTAAASKKELKGGSRKEYADAVFEMVKGSYARIGVPASSAESLMKYDLWWVYVDGEGKPIAFNLFKVTPFGKKSGLSGSDGSSEGRNLIKDLIRTRFKTQGFYGEVSGRVEEIAMAAGAPVVPAKYVPLIIKKEIEPEADGEHYSRTLMLSKDGGDPQPESHRKILMGKPNVDFASLDAKLEKAAGFIRKSTKEKLAKLPEDPTDLDMHLSCLMFDSE